MGDDKIKLEKDKRVLEGLKNQSEKYNRQIGEVNGILTDTYD